LFMAAISLPSVPRANCFHKWRPFSFEEQRDTSFPKSLSWARPVAHRYSQRQICHLWQVHPGLARRAAQRVWRVNTNGCYSWHVVSVSLSCSCS
jgi:hypothetical protein